MATGTLLAGFFALACTMQDVTALGNLPVSEPHALSLVTRDGRGAVVGWAEIQGQDDVTLRRYDDGSIILSGTTFKDGGDETWAVIQRIPGATDYSMEWLMFDTIAKDGRRSGATWSKGRCESLGATERASQ